MSLTALDGFRPRKPGPYRAETANVRGVEDWPYWIVTGPDGVNILAGPHGAVLTTRDVAERLADEWNASPATPEDHT